MSEGGCILPRRGRSVSIPTAWSSFATETVSNGRGSPQRFWRGWLLCTQRCPTGSRIRSSAALQHLHVHVELRSCYGRCRAVCRQGSRTSGCEVSGSRGRVRMPAMDVCRRVVCFSRCPARAFRSRWSRSRMEKSASVVPQSRRRCGRVLGESCLLPAASSWWFSSTAISQWPADFSRSELLHWIVPGAVVADQVIRGVCRSP